jgi:DNA polymerase
VKEREAKIAESGTTLDVLSSNQKFPALLESMGIEVPTKVNKNGDDIPALGKDDLGFRRMVADYPEHANLFTGRLAAKSTLDVTRTKRIVDIGSRGTLPMPLNYFGAHTGRWSGSDGLNPQNFRRGSELRKSIIAPPGWVILVADLSQIELRINFWFCGEDQWLQLFKDGVDVYRGSAALHYGVALEDVTHAQRFFGKTVELGLGYGMGWKKFRTTCALKYIYLSEAEAYETVRDYRASHLRISSKWRELSNKLTRLYHREYSERDGPVVYAHEKILLPNNMSLDYSGLTPTDTGDWYYGIKKVTKIYGGKMLENIIQALARIVVGEQILQIEREGIYTVSSTHDEVIMVVRENEADDVQRRVEEIMTTPPEWAPDLPLEVEGGWAREYSK